MKYYHRTIEPHLLSALKSFPAILITGPRQAGKSTLLQHCLKGYTYVTFDDPELRALAQNDPELFLSTHPAPLILDEIQYTPHLLPYIKIRIDKNRQKYGQYVLTGSQTFLLMEGISETLAGRIALFELYPFCYNEIPAFKKKVESELVLADQIIQGFYPEFYSNPKVDRQRWFSSYVATYLERDIRNLKTISDLTRFQTFLSLLATRVGSLLNLSEIGKECGISQPTAKSWLTLLEATYVIHLLKPYYKNKTKQLVKAPKLYFVDTGILCYLLGIDSKERFLKASERGSIFENMIIMDVLKSLAYDRHDLYFYRTTRGEEIDLLVEKGAHLNAYEIKFSKTPTPQMAGTLIKFQKEHSTAGTHLVCLRKSSLPLKEKTSTLYWQDINTNDHQ